MLGAMDDERSGAGDTRCEQRTALANGFLVRYTLAVLLNVIAEWAIFLGVLVYAMDRGDARSTGFAAVAMLVPYVAAAPLSGALAERHPPQRVRIAGMAVQSAAWAVTAIAAHADLAVPVVVATAMVGTAASTSLGPAGAVLRPAIVRSSGELTVANLWTGYAHNLSVLGGPLLAAAMLAVGGAPAVILACVASSLLALFLSLVRRPVDPPGGSELTDRIGPFALMRRELREVCGRPGVLGVLVVAGGQFFAIGALDIVIVVAADDELDIGKSGPGLLTSAFGVGALLSGAVSTVLVRRPRLAPVLGAAMLAAAASAIALGLSLSVVAAFTLLPILGLATSVQDVLGQMLLQRSADPRALASVFAVLEMASGVGLILGSVLAQVMIAMAGVRAAFIGVGSFFVIMLIGTVRSLRIADDSADVPVVAMSLLRRVPLFCPLPRPALEVVARNAVEIEVGSGTSIIRQGDHGHRFFTVATGRFEIAVDGALVQTVERGGSFGELALLADEPRAATVTATCDGSLLAIDRRPFLVAVTGHDSSRQAAWGIMQRLHGDAVPIEGPHEFASALHPPQD